VSPQGGEVLVANYSGGNIALLPTQPDGNLDPASDVEQHEGSSLNEQRQKGPHAHCIVTDSAGNYAFSADLGIDQVLIYRLQDNALIPTGHVPVAPGAGPRHFTFNPDGDRAYVINELNSTVTAFKYEDGVLEETQTIGTLPDGFDGDNFPADIHVSSDGRFVYGSNRGHDSIVVFGIDPDSGLLSSVQHEGTGGEWPRNFALDPTGRFLLVANQRTSNIVVFSRDSDSGRLTPTGQTLEIPSPVCVRFLV
jgi:6-phosphogluconolactonase